LAVIKPRFSKNEFAKRGDIIFEKDIRPRLKNEGHADFVAIDIETGAYEIDADEMAACDRLRSRVPDAQVWLRKVGSRFARRFGGRGNPVDK
jgi:hypothetical protein